MSDGRDLGRIAALRTLSPAQRLIRSAVLVGPIIVLAAVAVDAGSVYPPIAAVVVFLAAVCALAPDSHVGLLTVLLLAWYWTASVDHPTGVVTLAAGLGVLMFHTALAAATVAPPAARWSATMQRRWAGRMGVVAAITAAAWGAARLVADARIGGSAVLLAAALLALTGGAIWLRHRSLTP